MTSLTAKPAASTPPLMSRALKALFVAEFAAMTAFYSLSSAVPMYATSVGVSEDGVGFTTGILMLATVLTELSMPRLLAMFGHRALFAAGLVLLGAPAFALSGAHALPAILALSAIRGVGLGLIAVVGAALTASLAPKERRGEALGVYGAVGSIPAIAALPMGVWLVDRIGYGPVFMASAVCAIAGLPLLFALPRRLEVTDAPLSLTRAIRAPQIMRPTVVFACVAMASGGIITFLPFMVARNAVGLAAVGLLVMALVSTIARWLCGRRGDRGAPSKLWPAIAVAATGLVIVALSVHPVALIVAMVLFGGGFGMAQDASLTMMLQRASSADYDTVSTLWNMAYDAGWGLGAVVLGLIAAGVGYSAAFLIMAVATLGAGRLLLRAPASTLTLSYE